MKPIDGKLVRIPDDVIEPDLKMKSQKILALILKWKAVGKIRTFSPWFRGRIQDEPQNTNMFTAETNSEHKCGKKVYYCAR